MQIKANGLYIGSNAMSKVEVREEKTNRPVVLGIIAFALLALTIVMVYVKVAQPALIESVEWNRTHVVDSGETLWEIARSIPGAEKHDTRSLVDAIKKFNHIGSTLDSNMTITIPSSWEEAN